ncbi:hypothetical protein N1031_12870 [Herbiconiux moechotypicola]|uniref:Helix-turn-helix domain-containing protein n=1 Tax=Herbiconiux moechotypicola TaxID=637393 RepID=A0ABP5QNL6_9MICO|nr:hypothetical protein [Herbiconiux moechotypicola]MCS5730656.1 hypothetical protein [Herbiconiux moechotypicola]
MAEMSVAVLAERLGVTQRRANQIVAEGRVSAKRTDSGEWLVDATSAQAYERRHQRARGLTPDAAWALLFLLAGCRTDWVSDSTRARIRRRIRTKTAEELARDVAARSQPYRFRAANLTLAEQGLLLTGRSAIESIETDLLPDRRRVYGYVPKGASIGEWARAHFLVDDPSGRVCLFDNTIPESADAEVLPGSVVAADLAVAADARERAAGIAVLETMRTSWLRSAE